MASTQAAIAAAYANINAVYRAQFNVGLQVADMVIQSTTGGPAWNVAPTRSGSRCASPDISTVLNSLASWRSSNQNRKNSLWHQFTNCYPPSGTVGIAYIGVLCKSQGVGVSSVTSTHWLVVAHEMGHNFGGNHAFQLGQGRTGGILDYGDFQYPIGSGIYQFHPTYNQQEMCASMTTNFKTTGYTPCQSNTHRQSRQLHATRM